MTRKHPVFIPRSKLATRLEETEQIKRELTDLLIELETAATGRKTAKPGGWRHDPLGWQKHL